MILRKIIKRQSVDKWWVSGFNRIIKVQSSNLIANYIVSFSGKEGMYNDFYNTWSGDKRWNFNAQTHTATFTFK